MVPRAEEGRGKLRKAMVRCKQSLNHRYPNRATCWREPPAEWGTQGTETSKYLEEKKVKTIPEVAASEMGRA